MNKIDVALKSIEVIRWLETVAEPRFLKAYQAVPLSALRAATVLCALVLI
jgi:hypothetical protein